LVPAAREAGAARFGLGMDSSGPQGQTQPPKAAQGRANSELRHSPARLQGGQAPKKHLNFSAP